MEAFSYASKTETDILRELKTDESKGLSVAEAEERLRKSGGNILDHRELKWEKVMLRQFHSAFIYLLIGAAVIALLLGEKIDGLMILIFLSINVFLGFIQEYRSEKTVALLKSMVVAKVKTLRAGKISLVRAENLVVGDIIFLETGDRLPADVRFISTANFKVDESVITGESITACKVSGLIKKKPENFFEAGNLGFSGTSVASGSAKAVVVAVGHKTAMGKIARLATEASSVSSFEKGINDFSAFILKLIAITLLVVFLANILLRRGVFDFSELLLFSIALTVGVIPEALPLVTTFSLSRSARALAKKKVIVKRLSAVEDLGGVEVFCTDKTGTLTENMLTVAETWCEDKDSLLLYSNLGASDIKKKKTEPFD
ncbi:MAG: HAD-IC family P-type ATPase, partial [Candidatus Pacebacteria bacterium]|nr:HAD-IC family P-type ATPase [Candidatus Paceibacterota bacterium]